jgi:hypothetical protein
LSYVHMSLCIIAPVCLQENVFSCVQLCATAETGRPNSKRVPILICFILTGLHVERPDKQQRRSAQTLLKRFFYSITGLHVVWRDQANSRGGAREVGAAVDPTNAQPQHDIEALDFVQIEGVECVLQVGWGNRERVCVYVCVCTRVRARESGRVSERASERARVRGKEKAHEGERERK